MLGSLYYSKLALHVSKLIIVTGSAKRGLVHLVVHASNCSIMDRLYIAIALKVLRKDFSQKFFSVFEGKFQQDSLTN